MNMKITNGQSVHGKILLQLIEDRKLQVEILPGKTSSQVSGFSGSETVYVR